MVQEDVLRKEEKSLDVPSACTHSQIRKLMNRIEELNKVCGDAYKAHYECLDMHNQQYKDCRPAERGLNACVFKKMVQFNFEWTDGRDYLRKFLGHQRDRLPCGWNRIHIMVLKIKVKISEAEKWN
jgi:hypothetical protein